MINFIKGIFVGIFNIVPGLSGSALLIILGLYEKCLNKISTLFKNPKENFLFLFPIALGIIIGTYLFSKIIFICLNNYPSETYIIFTGFLLGTIPNLLKEATKKGFKKSYLIPFFITFTIGIILLLIETKNTDYIVTYNSLSLIKFFSIGILLSLSTIIPGISSTILLSLFNLYHIFQNKFISNECDKFTIRWFFTAKINSCAENCVDCVDTSPIPRHFDGVANGALHLARRRGKFLCNRRIQFFRNGIDYVRRLNGHFNPFTQISIAFDVRRNPDRNKNFTDLLFNRNGFTLTNGKFLALLGLVLHKLAYAFHCRLNRKRFDKIIGSTVFHSPFDNRIV